MQAEKRAGGIDGEDPEQVLGVFVGVFLCFLNCDGGGTDSMSVGVKETALSRRRILPRQGRSKGVPIAGPRQQPTLCRARAD